VIANSDSEADQALKLKVRDGVLYAHFDELSQSESADETKTYVAEHLDVIKDTAESVIRAQGYDYSVNVMVANDYFPTANYGDITLPAGVYDALRVEIGSAEGKNWWCVMFPPLCFVDVTKSATIPDEEKTHIKNNTSDTEYALLSDETREKDVVVSIKFKIIEWWQGILNKNKSRDKISDTKLVKADDAVNEVSEEPDYPAQSTPRSVGNDKLTLPRKK
jgi:stage II sporulation protein R